MACKHGAPIGTNCFICDSQQIPPVPQFEDTLANDLAVPRYGWTCPTCERAFAPHITECRYCAPSEVA